MFTFTLHRLHNEETVSEATERYGRSPLDRYIANAHCAPVLSQLDETDCARRWQTHADQAALDALMRANLRHVVYIARRFRGYAVSQDELIAEGTLGLLKAADGFDPERGLRFSTYAGYWIRSYMTRLVLKSWSLIGTGKGALSSRTFFRLRRERARAEALVGSDQARSEIARNMGLTPERVAELEHQIDQRDISLSQPSNDGSVVDLVDVVESTHDDHTELEQRDFAECYRPHLQQALEALDARERYVIQNRYMSDDQVPLAAIGRELGVSRERARQLEVRAKNKLRRSVMRMTTAATPLAS